MKIQEIKFKGQLHSYSVLIGNKTLNLLPNKIKSLCPKTKKIALILDRNVAKKFKKFLKNKLNKYELVILNFHASEKSKSIKTVNLFVEKLLRLNFNRADLIVGVGDGITGDVAGFVASIYKRGINYINIPTTLLAQVDASIGGKTGVNSNYGKIAISWSRKKGDLKLFLNIPANTKADVILDKNHSGYWVLNDKKLNAKLIGDQASEEKTNLVLGSGKYHFSFVKK